MAENVMLLVDDDPEDVALTIDALRQDGPGSRVVVVSDGIEALDYLFGTGAYAGRGVAGLPQVVLLDLRMPKLDGLEVLRRIRADERTSLLPVVVLTTSDEEGDVVRAYRLGANSYVRKPVNFDQFTTVVKQLGLYWTVVNRPPGKERSTP